MKGNLEMLMRKSGSYTKTIHRLDLLIGGLIFVTTLIVFWVSPVHQITDSRYSLLVSQNLLEHGGFALDHYKATPSTPNQELDWGLSGKYYQLEIVNGHLYYYFPPGTSVLSAPFVAAMKLCGMSAVNVDGTYNLRGEVRMQSVLAAVLMALLCVIFFCTARLVLPLWWSVLIALAGAFGTQVWSTASRGMWSDTWGILLVGVVVWMVLAEAVGKHRLNAVGLASVLAWTYFVRPTNAVAIIGVSVYVLLYHRRIAWRYMVTGAVWLMLFVVYSWVNFRHALPGYYRVSRLTFGQFWIAIVGNLISPSRGLLVYAPVLLFVAYLLARYWQETRFRRLIVLSVAVIAVHLIVSSGFTPWHGGGCFGARYSTGLVPWFVLLGIISVDAILRWHRTRAAESSARGWRTSLIFGGALLLLSVFINARGATARETWRWNALPVNIDEKPERVWQWSYPQFLAGLVRPPLREGFPLIQEAARIDFTKRDADKFLWYGWSAIEKEFRWTDGDSAAVVFAFDRVADMDMKIKCGAFIVPGKLTEQKVNIKLNGRRVGTLTLDSPESRIYSIALPASLLRRENTVVFELPDTASPDSFLLSEDVRLLGMNVGWIEFQMRAASAP